MIDEAQILPYQVSELPPGPWLVFAPHADDETFGMGGALALAAAQRIRTEVQIVTDGALGGTTPDLVNVRQQEAKKATALLGVHTLGFLGEPDRGLQINAALVARVAELIRDSRPATVFFPGLMEPHPDHRTTALLVWRALGLLPAAERPVPVAYEITVQNPANCLIDITAGMSAKQAAIAVYLSQLGENNYAAISQALNITRTFTLPPEVKFAEAWYRFTPQRCEQALPTLLLDLISTYAPGV